VLGTYLDRSWGLRRPVAERAAALSGGVRCGRSSGMGKARWWSERWGVARVGASGGSECVGRRWERPGTWVPRRRLPWQTAASLAQGGFRLGREHNSFIGAAAFHCAHGLPRRARGPRPRPARSAGGERGRTGGYSGVRPSTNARAPRGGPDSEGGLGARNALGRRGASVGKRSGRRGRRGSGAARAQRATSRRGVGRPYFVSLQSYSSAQNSRNYNRSAPSGE
jgi:hypothetical protein